MDGIKKESNSLPRILLIENDKSSIDVTRYFLKGICSIDSAENGETAIELAVQNNYPLILMDINLGYGASGIDITGQIRNVIGYKDTAIVALTAFAGPHDKEKFLASGMTHYLAKPFDRASLINLVRSILTAVEKTD